jgi:hypothetical protein
MRTSPPILSFRVPAHRGAGVIWACRWSAFALALALLFAPFVVRAAGEYEVKAAFLFNFAKFVEWPEAEASSAPVVIGVVGEDPFGEILPRTVLDETVKGRHVEVRHYQPGDDLADCQVLFVGHGPTAGLKELLERASARHILTVSDSEGFLAQGGAINFVLVGKNVRFDINSTAVRQAGLKMSSKLLAVAHTVKEHL